MDITKIKEVLQDVLSVEDLNSMEQTIQNIVKEEVEKQVSAERATISATADEFCSTTIAEKTKEIVAEYEQKYKEKTDQLEETITARVDKYLDTVTEKVSDDLLKDVAINEAFKPIVTGIIGLFEAHSVALDTEGHALLKKSDKKVKELEESLSQVIADKMDLVEKVNSISEKAELGAIKLLIAEKTADLTETERERVKTMCENKSFDELQSQIDTFTSLVTEQTKNTNVLDSTDITTDADCIQEDHIDVRHKDEEIDPYDSLLDNLL